MRMVMALVDYDNVCTAVWPEAHRDDALANLGELLNALTVRVASLALDSRELAVRLYGGWFDQSGRLTARGGWILDNLPLFRTRMNGLRVLPTLASALVCYPDVKLIGTHRSDAPLRQKMVDTMLTVDAITLALNVEQFVIVSDDEDFTPAAIASLFGWSPKCVTAMGGRRSNGRCSPCTSPSCGSRRRDG
jgi:hypothetical protein